MHRREITLQLIHSQKTEMVQLVNAQEREEREEIVQPVPTDRQRISHSTMQLLHNGLYGRRVPSRTIR